MVSPTFFELKFHFGECLRFNRGAGCCLTRPATRAGDSHTLEVSKWSCRPLLSLATFKWAVAALSESVTPSGNSEGICSRVPYAKPYSCPLHLLGNHGELSFIARHTSSRLCLESNNRMPTPYGERRWRWKAACADLSGRRR